MAAAAAQVPTTPRVRHALPDIDFSSPTPIKRSACLPDVPWNSMATTAPLVAPTPPTLAQVLVELLNRLLEVLIPSPQGPIHTSITFSTHTDTVLSLCNSSNCFTKYFTQQCAVTLSTLLTQTVIESKFKLEIEGTTTLVLKLVLDHNGKNHIPLVIAEQIACHPGIKFGDTLLLCTCMRTTASPQIHIQERLYRLVSRVCETGLKTLCLF